MIVLEGGAKFGDWWTGIVNMSYIIIGQAEKSDMLGSIVRIHAIKVKGTIHVVVIHIPAKWIQNLEVPIMTYIDF